MKKLVVVIDPETGRIYPHTIDYETGEIIISESYPIDKLIVTSIRVDLIDWEKGYIKWERWNAENSKERVRQAS